MLLKTSKFFLYTAVFSVVVVMTSTFFPFIGGKDYFFRAATELALVFTLLYWAFEAGKGEVESRFKNIFKRPLVIAVTAFAIVFLLASVFAYDGHAGFWSNFERGEGGFQVLHYYLFFLLLSLLFKTEKEWKLMFWMSIAAGTVMVLYGIGAALSIRYPSLFCATSGVGHSSCINFITPWQGAANVPTGSLWAIFNDVRFQGTLGNPAYVAPYIMYILFFLLYLWFSKFEKKAWLKNVGFASLAVFFLFFFVLGQTRGAFLGLVAEVFTVLLFLTFSKKSMRKIGVIVIAMLLLFYGTLRYFKDAQFVQNLPLGRFLTISTTDDSAQTRFWTWGSAWKGFLERPVLGWGPENFTTVFDKYFDPRHFVPGKNTETWFDRAHSLFFDALAETGILGFLAYFGMFATFFWEFFKKKISAIHAAGPGALVLAALVVAAPLGHLVQGIAIFDVLPMFINLFLFLAFATHYLYEGREKHAA